MNITELLELGLNNPEDCNVKLASQIFKKSIVNNLIFDINNIKITYVSMNATRVKLFENWLGVTFVSEIDIEDIFTYIEHKYNSAQNKEKTVNLDIQGATYLENHIELNDVKYDIEKLLSECCEGDKVDVTINLDTISFLINNNLCKLVRTPHGRSLLSTRLDMNTEVSLISKAHIYYATVISRFEELNDLFMKALICIHNMKLSVVYCEDDFEFDKSELIQFIYSGVSGQKSIILNDSRTLTVERITPVMYEVEIINGEFTDISIKFKRTAMSDTEKVEYINRIVKSA